jgi:molecular chaperone DnaK (HSP70)
LGIDFGTTYSCASVMLDEHIIVIQNSLGLRTIPSFVLFLENNKICVGELAKLQPSEEKNIIYNTKRLIGKNFDDKEVQLIKNSLSFKIERDNDFNLLKIKVNENDYYPDEISAMILKKIVKDSEYYLSKLLNKEIKIKNSIITAPAYFNNNQRKAILNAADIINLKVKRIINEPTSASLAYLYDNLSNVEKKILVLDLGGGTFDITFLNLTQNEKSSYCDIKCTGGDQILEGKILIIF